MERTAVHALLDATLDEIDAALIQEGRVSLSGFGTFEVRERRSRTGRHPVSGQTLTIPPRRTVVFRPGSGLREALGLTLAPDQIDT